MHCVNVPAGKRSRRPENVAMVVAFVLGAVVILLSVSTIYLWRKLQAKQCQYDCMNRKHIHSFRIFCFAQLITHITFLFCVFLMRLIFLIMSHILFQLDQHQIKQHTNRHSNITVTKIILEFSRFFLRGILDLIKHRATYE